MSCWTQGAATPRSSRQHGRVDRRAHPRPLWTDLPEALRSRVEAVLGDRVVAAESRQGGWSPGTADRVRLAAGGRAFVKAASTEVNEQAVALHRREAEVLHLLAGGGAAPALLAAVEHEPWFALVEEDVGGRHPDPGSDRDVAAVLDAVARLPAAGAAARALLRSASEDLAEEARGWRRLIEDDALGSVPIDRRSAERLDALAARHPDALASDRVVHLDLRFDNALIDGSGRGRLVDWPGAAIGAGWIDALTVVLEVRRLVGAAAAEEHLAHPVLAAAPPEDVDVLLTVLAAYFFDAARRPPSRGVEAVRGFQRLQGEVVLAWLRERRPALFS